MESQLLTVNDVLARLAVSRRTLYRLIAAGELPALKIGRATRVRAADLDAYIERRLEVGLAHGLSRQIGEASPEPLESFNRDADRRGS